VSDALDHSSSSILTTAPGEAQKGSVESAVYPVASFLRPPSWIRDAPSDDQSDLLLCRGAEDARAEERRWIPGFLRSTCAASFMAALRVCGRSEKGTTSVSTLVLEVDDADEDSDVRRLDDADDDILRAGDV